MKIQPTPEQILQRLPITLAQVNFWKTIEPYLSKKGLNSNNILLNQEGRRISHDNEQANLMNSFL